MLEALIDELNTQALDEIVVTGDLTNLSLTSEFRLAREMLDRLRLGARHVTAIPGNHDVYTLDALLLRPFHAHLGPYATSDSGDETFPVVRVRGPIAVVGASSARPSPVPFASGSLGAPQRARLEERLAELGRRGLFRILLMHHPPVDNRSSLFRGLRDRGPLQALLRRTGCELILHGHEHRDLDATVRGPHGPIRVSGVGSGTYSHADLDRCARYHIYEIAPATQGSTTHVVGREVRAFERESGRFVVRR